MSPRPNERQEGGGGDGGGGAGMSSTDGNASGGRDEGAGGGVGPDMAGDADAAASAAPRGEAHEGEGAAVAHSPTTSSSSSPSASSSTSSVHGASGGAGEEAHAEMDAVAFPTEDDADAATPQRPTSRLPARVRTSPGGHPSPEGTEERRQRRAVVATSRSSSSSVSEHEGRPLVHDDDVEEGDGEPMDVDDEEGLDGWDEEEAAVRSRGAVPTTGESGEDGTAGAPQLRSTAAGDAATSAEEDRVAFQLRAAADASRRLRAESARIADGHESGDFIERERRAFVNSWAEGIIPTIDGSDNEGVGGADNNNDDRPADVFASWLRRRRRRAGFSVPQPAGGEEVGAGFAPRASLPPTEEDAPTTPAVRRRPSRAGGNERYRRPCPEETTLQLLRGSAHVVNEARKREIERRRRLRHRRMSSSAAEREQNEAGLRGDDEKGACLFHREDEYLARPLTDVFGDLMQPESTIREGFAREDSPTDDSNEDDKDGFKTRVELLVRGCHRPGGILDVDYLRSLVEPTPLDRAQLSNLHEDESILSVLRHFELAQENEGCQAVGSSESQDQEHIDDLITFYISKLRSLRVPSSVPFVQEQVRRAYIVERMLIQAEERRAVKHLTRRAGEAVDKAETDFNSGGPNGVMVSNNCLTNENKLTLTLSSVCMASLNSLRLLVQASPSMADTDADIVVQPLNALDNMVRSFLGPLCFYKECSRQYVESSSNMTDIWNVLKDLLIWLKSVYTSQALSKHRDLALCTMLRICSATGMLSYALLTVEAIMDNPPALTADLALTRDEEESSDDLIAATKQYIQGVADHMITVKSSAASGQQVGVESLESVRFDSTEMSRTGLTLSSEDTLVRSTTSQHTHIYLNRGFTTGKWAWEFCLTEEVASDESTCLGAGLKPVTSSSYNTSPNLWMYRCYNGNLYQRGSLLRNSSLSRTTSSQRGKQRIHPDDIVRIELDCEKQTLSYTINGTKQQGVCFCDVTGGAVYPAVAFYGTNRSVKLLCVESVESTEEYGRGVRFYPDDDRFQRKMWHGELRHGERHGVGVLSYRDDRKLTDDFPEKNGFWCGHWCNDKQHGLSAWVLTDENGSVDIEASRLYWFEDGSKTRRANDEDTERALASSRGWACDNCRFVNTGGSCCLLCNSLRSMPLPHFMEDGLHHCKTHNACCASILQHLGQLAVARGQGCCAVSDVGALSLHGSPSHEDGTHAPYVVEPNMDVFSSLERIMKKFLHSGDDEAQALPGIAKISTLRLLKANFDCLATLKDGGICVEAQEESPMSYIRTSLESLLQEKGLIGQGAANALASGFQILFPDYESRCEIFRHLLSCHNGLALSEGGGQYTLLKNLLSHFGSDECINLLLPIEELGAVEVTIVEQLLQALFDCVQNSGIAFIQLCEEENHDYPATPDLSAAATQLLLSVYRSLISSLIVAGAERTRATKDHGSNHCKQLLVTFSKHTLRASILLCQKAKAEGDYDDMESRLAMTMVFSILPLFAISSLYFTNELWFEEAVIPLVSDLVHELDGLNSGSSKVDAVDHFLKLSEQRFIDTAMLNTVCSSTMREVPAMFDESGHSDDVSISHNGRLLRSTSSSNQHCLVDMGIKRGRAAWEFQLVSDSQDDECSAFGVATRPITSSVYESSPNMWVIRSYNGQCYNGTCSNFPKKSKIHPKDIVRFEVCMTSKTMRFLKNGVDEGVAFINLKGEVFPLVCMYRAGVEVRLIKMEIWRKQIIAQPPPPSRYI